MAQITLKGNKINTIGDLPAVGESLKASKYQLTKTDLSDLGLQDFAGKKIILNIFPSLDTAVCAASVRRFNAEASNLPDSVVLCISKDLPFAHNRFCVAEGLENVVSLSELRDDKFSRELGVRISDGPMAGLMARAVLVLDQELKVIYAELVPEIAQEPNYEQALEALK
ncbi:MAG: thiol peroxidase [Candidatus Cloacimonadales bacterium]